MKKKESSQEETKKRLRARIKEYINKKSIGVNIQNKAIDEVTDFIEDILVQYTELLKEDNVHRIYHEAMKYVQDCGSKEPDERKIRRIENKSITVEQAVDVRHGVIKRLISQNML